MSRSSINNMPLHERYIGYADDRLGEKSPEATAWALMAIYELLKERLPDSDHEIVPAGPDPTPVPAQSDWDW